MDEYLEAINEKETYTNHNEVTCNIQEKQDRTTAIHKANTVMGTDDKENNNKTVENLHVRNKKQEVQTQNNEQSAKRTVASQRLDKTIEYTSNLVSLIRSRNKKKIL